MLLTYDVLEWGGEDWRPRPLTERRGQLEQVIASPRQPRAADFGDRGGGQLGRARRSPAESRDRGVEGFMLKRRNSAYGVGRKRGDWWKWKIEPYTIDAVLIYAQRGSGKRANLYTDYTFAVWDQGELTPFAKAYSGLTDAEIREVDRFVRATRTRALRAGPQRDAGACVRAGLRGHPAVEPAQIRRRGPLPAHPPLAPRQEDRGRRLARYDQGANTTLIGLIELVCLIL